VPLLIEAIDYHFGDLVITPSQKNSLFPNLWPSQNQLLKMGKQGKRRKKEVDWEGRGGTPANTPFAVMFASRQNYVLAMNSTVFWSPAVWNEWNPNSFVGYPKCIVGKSIYLYLQPIFCTYNYVNSLSLFLHRRQFSSWKWNNAEGISWQPHLWTVLEWLWRRYGVDLYNSFYTNRLF